MFPSQEICQTNTQCGTAESPKTFNINYKCDACTTNADCAKCFFETSNESGADVEVQTCLGDTCTEGIGTASTTISRCTGGKDFLGQQCECCVNTVEVSRFCTTNSEALSQKEVTAWFKFEGKLQMMFVFLVVALFGFFY